MPLLAPAGLHPEPVEPSVRSTCTIFPASSTIPSLFEGVACTDGGGGDTCEGGGGYAEATRVAVERRGGGGSPGRGGDSALRTWPLCRRLPNCSQAGLTNFPNKFLEFSAFLVFFQKIRQFLILFIFGQISAKKDKKLSL